MIAKTPSSVFICVCSLKNKANRFYFEGNHRVCEHTAKERDRSRTRVAIERGANTIGDARLPKLEINRFCIVREGVYSLVYEYIPAFRRRTHERTSVRANERLHSRSGNSKRPGAISSPTCPTIFGVFNI